MGQINFLKTWKAKVSIIEYISVFPILDKCTISELKTIIKGFLFSYRGSPLLFKKLQGRITAALHEFSIGELSEIAKAYHITENEDPEFMMILERSSFHINKSISCT